MVSTVSLQRLILDEIVIFTGQLRSHVDGKDVLKTASGAAKAIDTGASSANGVADELHKTKGVSEGSGDVVGASTGALRRL